LNRRRSRKREILLLNMSTKNIFNYAKQFSTGLNAALPINRVLETLSRTAPTKGMRAASKEVNRSIESGATLAQAFERHSNIFPDFLIRMIEVGEKTGRLEQVAESLATHYEERLRTARAVRQELYPIVAHLSVLMALIVLIGWLMEGVAALTGYADAGAWTALVITAVWAAYNLSRGFRDAVGAAWFQFPFVRRLVLKFCLSRFCEAMRMSLEAGLDIGAAIKLSADSCGNSAYRKRVMRALEHIEKGASISESLDKTGVFPFDVMQMLIVGEESGKLHEAMEHVANLAREQATQNLRLVLVLGIRGLYVMFLLYTAFMVVSFYMKIYGGILNM